MKIDSRTISAGALAILAATSFAQPAPTLASLNIIGPHPHHSTAAGEVMAQPAATPGTDAKGKAIISLRKDLPGTKWKAVPQASLRGGLVASISFTDKTVEPGGYKYEAVTRSLTMTFTHGAKLSLDLSKDGKHLEYPRGEIVYELVTE